MTKIDRIRLNLKTLLDLKDQGIISNKTWVYENRRLNDELAIELGGKKKLGLKTDDIVDEEE